MDIDDHEMSSVGNGNDEEFPEELSDEGDEADEEDDEEEGKS